MTNPGLGGVDAVYQYRIIVADDEVINCRGLCSVLEEECPDVEITGQYADGQAVIEHLQRAAADVVITDIRMPVKTGLDVARYIREKRLNTRIIIMTGYRDFEYAKEALNIGVDALVEKPLDLDRMVAEVRRLCGMQRETSDSELQSAADQLEQHARKRQDLQLFFFGAVSISIIRERYGDALPLDNLCAVVEFCLSAQAVPPEFWTDLGEDENGSVCAYLLTENGQKARFLVFAAAQDEARAKNHILQYIHNTQKLLSLDGARSEYSVNWHSCLGDLKKQQYDNAASLFLENAFYGDEKRWDLIYQIVGSFSPIALRELIHTVLELAQSQLDFESGDFAARADGMVDTARLLELLRIIRQQIDETSHKKNLAILQIEKYIYENCGRRLKLSDIAQTFFFNYAYLSRIFKQETGKNFSDYLTDVRISRAKELLLSGEHSVEQVSLCVGCDNPSYFRKLFKKRTGMTPKQFMLLKEHTNDA